jgi:hypothetical protein
MVICACQILRIGCADMFNLYLKWWRGGAGFKSRYPQSWSAYFTMVTGQIWVDIEYFVMTEGFYVYFKTCQIFKMFALNVHCVIQGACSVLKCCCQHRVQIFFSTHTKQTFSQNHEN